jgi:single-strand DNA-binding protein
MDLNRATITGYLGRDAEVLVTAGGTQIIKFSVASTEARKKGDEWQNLTEWHSVVQFGAGGGKLRDALKKGTRVFVEGRIQTSKYQGKDGVARSKTEIVANVVIPMSCPERAGPRGAGPEMAELPSPRPVLASGPEPGEDELPF